MNENQMNQMETGTIGGQPVTEGINANGALAAPPKKKKTGLVIVGIIFGILLLLGAGVFGMLKYIVQQDKDASAEMVEAFMKAYGRLHLEDAFETFHPDVRDDVIEEQVDRYMVSGLTGLERYLDLYFGGMELSYEVDESKRLSEEELEDFLSEIDDSYGADLDISKAYVYRVTEVFSGENGTLKLREDYFVGKEGEDWYIIAVSTDKIVKDDVDFSISDYLTGFLYEFLDLFEEAINECDGEMMEEAYAFMHPEIRDTFIEQMLLINHYEDLGDFVEQRNDLYGGFSAEYEILQINYLGEREWNAILRQIEDYFDTEFDFGMRGVWEFDIEETFSGNNGTVVMVENYFVGEEDGKWYVIDINTEEVVSNNLRPGNSYTGSEGYDSMEEALDHFIYAYEDFDITKAYMAFHPLLREEEMMEACYYDGAEDVDNYEEMLYSHFGGSLTVSYSILQKQEFSQDELAAYSMILWNSETPPANILDACLILLKEHYEGRDTTLDRAGLIMAGRDGDQWFLYNLTMIPEDVDLDYLLGF